jgi:hypothetical protein
MMLQEQPDLERDLEREMELPIQSWLAAVCKLAERQLELGSPPCH